MATTFVHYKTLFNLLELFGMVVQQFGLVVEAFKVLHLSLGKSVSRHDRDRVRFDVDKVWAQAQVVMQNMLTDYLDFKRSRSAAMQQQESTGGVGVSGGGGGGGGGGPNEGVNASVNHVADINACFVRRKGQVWSPPNQNFLI